MTEPLPAAETLLTFARGLADLAAPITLAHFRAGSAVLNKAKAGAFDPVTEADRHAEALIRAAIRARFPGHGLLGEEHGHEPGSEPYTWVIDPIDGTRSFIAGIPLWTTLIALNDGRRPVLGVIDQPYLGERYLGTPDEARLEARGRPAVRLRTRRVTRLAEAVFSTTAPELFRTPAERRALGALSEGARLVRYGCDCYAYALLAAGLIDLVVEVGLNPWDVQAFIPIIEAAGGAVARWDAGPPQDGGSLVAAASSDLLAEALAVIDRARQA